MHQHFFEHAYSGRIIIDGDTIIDCNTKAVKDLLYPDKATLLATPFHVIGTGDFVSKIDNAYDEGEVTLRKFDGTPLSIVPQFTRMVKNNTQRLCMQWQPKNQWDGLEKNIAYIFRSVINSSPDLISYKDYINIDGMYFGANHAFEESIGKSEDEIIGRTDTELFGEEQGEKIRQKDRKVLESGEDLDYEEWVEYPDGRRVLLHTKKTLLQDEDGTTIGLLTISRDMTQEYRYKIKLEESEKRYKELANTDDLTGIPNRRLFFELAREYFKTSLRQKVPLSMMMIDIDYFKAINDTYGHMVGDHVVQFVAAKIKSRLRESDLVARYAGDEFVALLYNTDLEGGRSIAEELRDIFVETPFLSEEGKTIPIAISIGVVMYQGEKACESLLTRADEALYLAKRRGRNRVETQ